MIVSLVLLLLLVQCRAFNLGSNSVFQQRRRHQSLGPTFKTMRLSVIGRDLQPPIRQNFEKSVNLNKEMNQMLSRESFMLLPEVVRLANDGLVIIPDIEELWDSFVGDADGVSQDEAYELLCMVHDLPDPEDMQYYEDQFALLATGNTMVAFRSILMWSDVRELIDEGAITESELKVLYNRAVKQASEHGEPTLTIAQFRIFNRLLDDLLDEKEVVSSPSQEISTPVEDSGDIDAWSSTFDPLSVLDEEMVDEYTEYFLSKTESKTGSLSKQEFMSWSDIQELLTEGSITEELLEQAWTEAAGRSKGISFDRFLRLNVRLDILMDDEFPETETVTADSISTADNVEDSASLDDSFSTIQEIITPTTSTTTTRSTTSSTGEAITQESQLSAMLSEDELQLMEALDQADNLLNMGAFGEFDRLTSGVEDLRLAALQPARSSASTSTTSSAADTAVAEQLNLLKEQVLLQCRQVQSCGVGFSAARIVVSSSDDEDTDTEEDQQETQITQLCLAIQAVIDTAPPLAGTRDLKNIRQALLGRWQLLFTNSEMCSFYHGVTGFTNVIPRAKFSSLAVEYTSDGYISEGKYLEKISTPLGELAVTACTNWELMEEPSFMSNADSIVLRNYCAKVTAGPFTFEAQENWKSLRALAMNEVMYVDDEMLIVRNCGALGIFFVFEKKE